MPRISSCEMARPKSWAAQYQKKSTGRCRSLAISPVLTDRSRSHQPHSATQPMSAWATPMKVTLSRSP